jgi:hypothetical protein
MRTATNGFSRVYPSKRDGWLEILIWISVMVMAVAAVIVARQPGPAGLWLGFAGVLLGSAGFSLWILYGTSYRLVDRDLLVRSGPFRWRVPLDSIVEVVPSRNPSSSPACSLDRLQISCAGPKPGILISPEDKRVFLQDLVSRSPGLRLEGERAVSA